MSEPVKMFGAYSSDGITAKGLGWWMSEGHLVNVNGEDMVRTGSVILEMTSRWKPTRQEAMNQMADRCEELASQLLRQALRLREGQE